MKKQLRAALRYYLQNLRFADRMILNTRILKYEYLILVVQTKHDVLPLSDVQRIADELWLLFCISRIEIIVTTNYHLSGERAYYVGLYYNTNFWNFMDGKRISTYHFRLSLYSDEFLNKD